MKNIPVTIRVKSIIYMLKGIPAVLSLEPIKMIMETGHENEIVLAYGSYSSLSCVKRLIGCNGHCIPEILDVILNFFP